ncbi:CaiB/BaiF CoA-transferase family protein [Novosphingobium sp. 9U]|uniref:CaiB/BaiF CoA transferase family protein n=1 Tax=Novosphingobium sp. 9U TaxID=2653158 RepID=UPI0012EEE427|nr:CoA transferase [Novosphingobium sp. 9U]VWX54200.1 CoA-transferase [Novosphingobium sp. 9U]
MSALKGLRIVELAEHVAGEYCGKLLADFGAEVIKVERPGGSPTRHLGPFLGDEQGPERSGLFAYLNTNKQSLVLDIGTVEGRAGLKALLASADAVIDDHGAQWLETADLSPTRFLDEHPGLILCSVTPFGLDAPAERAHATDLTVMHASGLGYHTPSAGDAAKPPLKGAGRFQASYEAGLEGALCVAAAIHRQARTGHGTFIDVSAQEVLAGRLDYVLGQMIAGDMDVSESRHQFDLGGPAGIFPCRGGFIYIFLSTPGHWQALRTLMGDPEEVREFPANWLEVGLTPERIALCRKHLVSWLAGLDKDEAAAIAQENGITLVPVNDMGDLARSPQVQHRGYFQTVEHPEAGPTLYPTVGYKLGASPAKIEAPAPKLASTTAAAQRPARSRTLQAPGKGPLAGVRVLELTKVWAGPFAGKLLAFLGAEVIRVESRGSLDVTRTFGVSDMNKAPGFMAVNPQKLSVQIDMKSKEGLALLKQLAGTCDIVIENMRPGALERLGLGYEALKAVRPDIILTSMSMYGAEGPLAYQTGYAPCFVALSGLSSLVGYEGEPPSGMNIRYSDSSFGAAAAFASLVALRHREGVGEGQFVDVSAVEILTSLIGDTVMDFSLNGRAAACDGNRHADMAPHGLYRCTGDDWIAIAVQSDAQWRALATAIGIGADPRFETLACRKENEAELDAIVSGWTRDREAGPLSGELQALGIAAAKSANSVDLIGDGHLWSRGFYRHVDDQDGEARAVLGPSWRMSDEAEITRPAPRLGEHNAYILGEVMGLGAEEQDRLREAGALR